MGSVLASKVTSSDLIVIASFYAMGRSPGLNFGTGVGRNGLPNMLLATYIRPKRLTWRVTFGLDDLPGGLPRRPEAAGGPGRRFAMSILTIRFIPGLVWHNFWHLPLQPCVARAGCCGHAPVRGACAILSAAFRVDWW